MYYRVFKLFVLLCLLPPLGCGGNPLDRQAVSGKVVLDSKPLDHGSIQFCPERTQRGIFAGALIVNGKYEVPGSKGLPPGKYTVRISAAIPGSNAAPKGPPGMSMSKPLQERIPAQYNAESRLTVEVKSGGGNAFDFALKTQPGSQYGPSIESL